MYGWCKALLWWRANARNISQHTLYGIQHIHINLTLIHCTYDHHANTDQNLVLTGTSIPFTYSYFTPLPMSAYLNWISGLTQLSSDTNCFGDWPAGGVVALVNTANFQLHSFTNSLKSAFQKHIQTWFLPSNSSHLSSHNLDLQRFSIRSAAKCFTEQSHSRWIQYENWQWHNANTSPYTLGSYADTMYLQVIKLSWT